jgi:outer membrane receptor for ferrienterochelin and colicins
MRIIIFILITLCCSQAQAQIRGRVIDARSKEALPGVVVTSLNGQDAKIAVTTTKASGLFQLRETGGERKLRFHSLGYYDTTISLPWADSIVQLRSAGLGNADITVTANRVATAVQDLAVSTVTARAAEIQSRSPQGLDNILRSMSGVTVTESQVSIRGSSGYARAVGSRVLLLMDGMPFLSGDNGDMKFDAIPFPAVDRVEVIKGAGSALYGSNAIGGVVNVLTRDPREQWKYGVAITAGQYGDPKYEEWKIPELTGRFYNLDAGIENKWDDIGVLATGSYRKNEGYRIGDDVERFNIFAKGIYSSSPDLTLRASTLIANDQHGGWLYWKGLADPYMDNDSLTAVKGRTHSDRINTQLGADYAIDDNNLWVSKTAYYSTQYITDGVPELDDDGAQSRAKVLSMESFLNSDLFATLNSTFGVNLNHYLVSSTVLSDQTALGLASFLQLEWLPLDEVSVLPGIRFDRFKANNIAAEQQLSPKIGVNYRPIDEVAVRASYGSGFKVPTLTERFIDSKMVGFTIIPNTDLKAEKSRAAEVGAMYRNDFITLDAAAFRSTYEDMIEPQFIGDKIQFNNITKALQLGHEEFVELRPFKSDLLKLRTGYTYVYSVEALSWPKLHVFSGESYGNVLPYRPRHLVQSRLEWNPENFNLSTDFRYISAYENTDSTLSRVVKDGDVRNASYVLDARASVALKEYLNIPIKLTLQVQNLLNYYYVEIVGNIGPLRSYSLKIETTL